MATRMLTATFTPSDAGTGPSPLCPRELPPLQPARMGLEDSNWINSTCGHLTRLWKNKRLRCIGFHWKKIMVPWKTKKETVGDPWILIARFDHSSVSANGKLGCVFPKSTCPSGYPEMNIQKDVENPRGTVLKMWLFRVYATSCLENGNHPKNGCSKLRMSHEFEMWRSETTDEPSSRVAAKPASDGESSGKNGENTTIPSPLVGGLNPSEKYEFVNWDDEIPNISGKIKFMATSHHQPVLLVTILITSFEIGEPNPIRHNSHELRFGHYRQRSVEGDPAPVKCHGPRGRGQSRPLLPLCKWRRDCPSHGTSGPQMLTKPPQLGSQVLNTFEFQSWSHLANLVVPTGCKPTCKWDK